MSLEQIAPLDLASQKPLTRYKSLEALRGRKDSFPPIHESRDDSALTQLAEDFASDLAPAASAPVSAVPPIPALFAALFAVLARKHAGVLSQHLPHPRLDGHGAPYGSG
ncbi:Phosphoinositide phospholipase C [Yarrowia sp. B02]|nr:Phosphoinositide phospholipase C [Yarrowia sp. B02]